MELIADVGALDGETDAAAVVAAPVLVDEGLVFHGLLQGVHHGQELIVHLHQGGGLPGSLLGLRRYGGHRLPLVADLVQGDDGLVGNELAVGLRVVRPGDDNPDAANRLGLLHPDGFDSGVGMGTAGQGAVELSGEVHVRAVLRRAGDLLHRVLSKLGVSHDRLVAGGVLPVNHQTVPLPALLLELFAGPKIFLFDHVVLSFSISLPGRGRILPFSFS